MITPYLEKLIHQGKAQVLTLALTGGCSILKMPASKHCVITGITAFPFYDLPNGEDFNKSDNLAARCMHQLRIGSQQSSNVFMYRWSFKTIQNTLPSPAMFVPDQQPVQNDVYLLHTDHIFFEWLHNPKPGAWSTVLGAVPSEASDIQPPVGYGTEIALDTLRYNDAVNSRMTPYGQFNKTGLGTVQFNQFQFANSNDTKITTKNPELSNWLYTLPLLNVQLVMIDGTPGDNWKNSGS